MNVKDMSDVEFAIELLKNNGICTKADPNSERSCLGHCKFSKMCGSIHSDFITYLQDFVKENPKDKLTIYTELLKEVVEADLSNISELIVRIKKVL